jgi:hypothetical protein
MSSNYLMIWPAKGAATGVIRGRLPRIQQGSQTTLTILAKYDNGTDYDLTGLAITGIAVDTADKAVYALSGDFTGAEGSLTWALSAGDVGTPGEYIVILTVAEGSLPWASFPARFGIAPTPEATAIQNEALVGVSSSLAAWLASAEGAYPDPTDLGASEVAELGTDGLTAANMLRIAAAGGLEQRTPVQVRADIDAEEAGAAQAVADTLGTAAEEDTGTAAGNVVQLDGSARLPAVDGSLLTNLDIPDPKILDNDRTADPYTAATGDLAGVIRKPSGTVIVPAGVGEAGEFIELLQSGDGELAVISQGEATVEGMSGALAGQFAGARLRKRTGETWSLTGQLSDEWADVDAPDAAFNFVPFTIQRNGRRFRPDPAWNLQDHLNITVVGTYYVDKTNGNNSNSGLDWDNALQTLAAAFGKSDSNRIFIRNSDFLNSERGAIPARDMELIGVGDNVRITSDLIDQATGSWSLVDSHYERNFGGSAFVARVLDYGTLDSDGNPTWLVPVGSVALVDSTPGSFHFPYTAPNSTMHVHLPDGREPDGNVKFLGSLSFAPTADNRKFYFENIEFVGDVRIRNSTSTGGLEYGVKGCVFYGNLLTVGVDAILQNVLIATFGDGHNIDIRNTVVSNVVEVDCQMTNQSLAPSDQASTGHSASNIVRINGRYYEVGGQCIADVTGCQVWMLGSEMHTARTSNIGFFLNGDGWLDRCFIHDVATDINAEGSGTTVHIRDLISSGNFTGAGSVVTY